MSDRRFRWLLWLFPASFRDEHRREMLQVWRDERRDAARAGRRGVWRQALKDTLRVGPREYVASAARNLTIACRTLRRAPAFTLAAVLTLGIGTGATAAVFSLLNGVLLRPLPWQQADAVGLVWATAPSGNRTWLSAPEVEEIRRHIGGLTGVAAFTDVLFAYSGDGAPVELQALAVSHDFFRVLGIPPDRGRDFTPQDDYRTAARVVILGHAFWQAHLGAKPGVVGRTIRLNDQPYTVAGIVPASFEWLPPSSVIPEKVDVWVALEPHLVARDRTMRLLHAIGRLHDNATFDSVTAELDAYTQRVKTEFPGAYVGGRWSFAAGSFKDDVLREARAPLYAAFGLVVLVLLMACGNVAHLLLARGQSRRVETMVRSALGAGPATLAGELMAEALVLATLGSALGLGFALATPAVIRALDVAALPRLAGVGMDWRVGLAVVALLVLTTAIFAFFPLLERMRLRTPTALMTDRSGSQAPGAAAAGRLLVVLQTGLAVTVVIAAVFLADAFRRLQHASVGFDTERVLTARVTMFTTDAQASTARYYDAAVAAVERVSGVERAGAVTQLPLSGAMLGSTFLAGDGREPHRVDVDLRGATGGYFAAMGLPVRRGRTFDSRDTASAPPVALVDERFARVITPDGNVVGRRVLWFRQPDVDIEIVGVVGSVRHRGVDQPPVPTVYRPIAQYPRASMFIVAKMSDGAEVGSDRIATAIGAVPPVQPVADVATMEERAARATSRLRASVVLTGGLALLALLLAVVGVYGVLSFGVSRRGREFGLRLALGASPASIRRLVLRDGLLCAGAGCGVGVLGAWLFVRAASRVFAGGSADFTPYAIGAALVVACAAAALWLPARRASRVGPMILLR